MGIVTGAGETILRSLASLEFNLTKAPTPNYARRLYLRYMRVEHGRHVSLGSHFYIRNRGNLSLGERCGVGSFSRIWNYSPIRIGDDFMSAGGLTLNSATHDPVTLRPEGRPINIGSRVWCGVNVTILGGVTIGDDVVVGAGAVVVADIPCNSVAVGVPAKAVKRLVRPVGKELWSFAATSPRAQ